MHTGSRAFCFLMALAATGTECASASPNAPVQMGTESKLIAPAQPLPAAVVPETVSFPGSVSLGMVLGVVVKPYLKASFESNSPLSLRGVRYEGCVDAPARSSTLSLRSVSFPAPSDPGFNRTNHDRSHIPRDYNSDGRVMASIADANERQLLFVKITRG